MRPILGIIADDLTGGLEAASMLVSEGVLCDFVTDPSLIRSSAAQVVVLAQRTRVAPVASAISDAEEGALALLNLGVRQLFFKYCATFDSTDDGNIGPVAERLMQLTGADVTAYCPSSPEVGRYVFNGHLFVGTQLVSDSPKRQDPLTPMTDPRLVEVLARQCRGAVGLLPHSAVRAGGSELASFVEILRDKGFRHVIVDAIYDEDLEAIADLTVDWPLMTGNSPIVAKFPARWRERGWVERTAGTRLPAVDGAAAVLAGSCAERTLEQLACFEAQRPVLRIDLLEYATPEHAVADALHWAQAHLTEGPVAITTSATPEEVGRVQAKLGRQGAAHLAERIIGHLAVALRTAGVRRFLVAGGETSGSVVESLGIKRLTVGPYEGPGVSRATAMDDAPVALCLKSGKLGAVEMFLPVLETMRGQANE